jgi:hypothetical protein
MLNNNQAYLLFWCLVVFYSLLVTREGYTCQRVILLYAYNNILDQNSYMMDIKMVIKCQDLEECLYVIYNLYHIMVTVF